jgi:hypothetical protein
MRILRNVLLVVLGVLVLFISDRIIVLSRSGELLWFVIQRHAVVTFDGHPSNVSVHREWKNPYFIVTRNRSGKRESYFVAAYAPRAFVQNCDGWTAPRLPIFPFLVISSEFVDCDGLNGLKDRKKAALPDARVTVGEHWLRFTDEDGSIVQVHWE